MPRGPPSADPLARVTERRNDPKPNVFLSESVHAPFPFYQEPAVVGRAACPTPARYAYRTVYRRAYATPDLPRPN